jgi:amino acid permease
VASQPSPIIPHLDPTQFSRNKSREVVVVVVVVVVVMVAMVNSNDAVKLRMH